MIRSEGKNVFGNSGSASLSSFVTRSIYSIEIFRCQSHHHFLGQNDLHINSFGTQEKRNEMKRRKKTFTFRSFFSQRFSINNLIHFTLEWLFQINLHKIRVPFELPWKRENMQTWNNHIIDDLSIGFYQCKSLSRTNLCFVHCYSGYNFIFKQDWIADVCTEFNSGFSVFSSYWESTFFQTQIIH